MGVMAKVQTISMSVQGANWALPKQSAAAFKSLKDTTGLGSSIRQ